MAATSTLKTIADEVVEETAIGTILPAFTGTTTTLTLSTTGSSELRGPFTGKKIPIGSPILITAGGTPGEDTFVSDWVPSTGVITVSPAITTGATDGIIFTDRELDHGDRLLKAIDRAYKNHCSRWIKMPLTFVPGGDMVTAVSTYWTASAGTASLAFLTLSEVAGGRALQLTHSASANAISGTIPAEPGAVWYFDTAIRATTATGVTATLEIVDVTNTAVITPTYTRGDGSTTNNAFAAQVGQFTVPATCDQIAFRLLLSASGTVQMSQLIACPLNVQSFPISNRILSTERIGNFYYISVPGSLEGAHEQHSYSEPITTGGRTHSFSNDNDHLVVTFNFIPSGPVYYDELIFGLGITTWTATSTFPLDQIVKWTKYELYKYLYTRENLRRGKTDSGVPMPSIWRTPAREALREAKYNDYEPEMVQVYGRA